MKSFEKSGIRWRYPQNWTLETEDSTAGWTAALYSPATAFMVVSLHTEEDDPAHLAESALLAMRETYPDLEAVAALETIAGQPALGYDLNFFMLDLTNTCWIRALHAGDGCVLILTQATDDDLETYGPVLHAVRASLEVEDV